MAWWDERYSAFDTETTGVDPETDRIVSYAIVSVGGGEPTRQTGMIIDPGVPVPDEAAAVHGITTERAQKEGMAAKGAIPALAGQITTCIRSGRPLVVMNAPFDLTMLDRECRRYGCEPPPWGEARIIDPRVIDLWLDRYRKRHPPGWDPDGPSSRTLTGLCRVYDVTLGEDAHDAAADALASARLVWRIMAKTDAVQGRHPEIIQCRALWKGIREDVAALVLAQAAWSAEQTRGLRAYFEGRGEAEKAASVHEGWPVVELSTEVKA
jgi:DNA polymerase-3 subunit epsilon